MRGTLTRGICPCLCCRAGGLGADFFFWVWAGDAAAAGVCGFLSAGGGGRGDGGGAPIKQRVQGGVGGAAGALGRLAAVWDDVGGGGAGGGLGVGEAVGRG